MRILMILLGLGLTQISIAADKADIQAAKADWKAEKKAHKDYSKLAKKWQKLWDKRKLDKMDDVDADLLIWTRDALADLRKSGVDTSEKGGNDGAPLREPYRDLLVELEKKQDRFDDESARMQHYKRKAVILDELDTEMLKRVARRKTRFDNVKAS